MDDKYTPLTIESLPQRLGVVSAITDQIGGEIRNWKVKEEGDGNLNLVFIVKGRKGSWLVSAVHIPSYPLSS